MAKKDSFIHVKLEYDEAKKSKMDILSSEMDIINMIKSLEKYVAIRNLELKLKTKLYREIKKIAMDIKLLEINMPHVQAPKPIRPLQEKPIEIKSKGGDELERQLAEIQRRLKELSY